MGYLIGSTLGEKDIGIPAWSYVYGLLVAIDGLIEGWNGVEKTVNSAADNFFGFSGTLLKYSHIVYCIGMMAFVGYGFTATAGLPHFKVGVLGLLLMPGIGATLLTELLMKWLGFGSDLFTLMLYQSAHVLSALALLFLLHSAWRGRFTAPKRAREDSGEAAIDCSNAPS
jgi:hypothetical protein